VDIQGNPGRVRIDFRLHNLIIPLGQQPVHRHRPITTSSISINCFRSGFEILYDFCSRLIAPQHYHTYFNPPLNMNFFNRQKARTPADTVKSLRENIQRLDQSESGESKRRVSLIFSSKDIAPPARGLKEIGLIGLASFVETWSSTEPLTAHTSPLAFQLTVMWLDK